MTLRPSVHSICCGACVVAGMSEWAAPFPLNDAKFVHEQLGSVPQLVACQLPWFGLDPEKDEHRAILRCLPPALRPDVLPAPCAWLLDSDDPKGTTVSSIVVRLFERLWCALKVKGTGNAPKWELFLRGRLNEKGHHLCMPVLPSYKSGRYTRTCIGKGPKGLGVYIYLHRVVAWLARGPPLCDDEAMPERGVEPQQSPSHLTAPRLVEYAGAACHIDCAWGRLGMGYWNSACTSKMCVSPFHLVWGQKRAPQQEGQQQYVMPTWGSKEEKALATAVERERLQQEMNRVLGANMAEGRSSKRTKAKARAKRTRRAA